MYGFQFDLSAIIYLNFIFIILSLIPGNLKEKSTYQKSLRILFIVINSLALSTNFGDIEYFKFTDKRSTADLINYLGMGDDFSTLLPQYLKDFWHLSLFWIASVLFAWFAYPKLNNQKTLKRTSVKGYLLQSFTFIITISLVYIAARGIDLKPLRIINAAQYTSSQNIPLVLNTPFTLLKTYNKKDLTLKKYFNEKELTHIYHPIHNYTDSSQFQKDNVVIIIMESFGKEYIGALNNNEGYTPFLDSLIKKSKVFPFAYANGKKSIEALPSILSSLPPLMDNSFITSSFSANQLTSLATTLKKKGYHSSFFHGGTNGTMGFDHFIKLAEIEEYYGRSEYNNEDDYDGNWGIYDEEFFQYFANKLNEFQKPFFSSIFSLSSHHPYTIPEKHKGKFPKGKLAIHQSIRYADYSLMKFFETASTMPWFSNTLFIITADHTSLTRDKYYKTKIGRYSIPVIFYHPGDSSLTGIDSTITQQIDIMPSILDYLNYDQEFVAYGNSVFDNNSDQLAINYLNGIYQFIKENYTLHFDGNKSIALFNTKSDSLLKNNLINSSPEKVIELEKQLKAIVQSYNDRLINNDLTIEE